jgi:hypothetical protein
MDVLDKMKTKNEFRNRKQIEKFKIKQDENEN